MQKPVFMLDNSKEGETLPASVKRVVDSHVHIFPQKIFRALGEWFEMFGWPLRYKMDSEELIKFLLDKGLEHAVVFPFSHKPGISESLNSFTLHTIRKFKGRATGLATVYPGEKNASSILSQAFKNGLSGVKLHAHVQCFDLDKEYMDIIFDECEKYSKPLVIHAGREPKSEAYPCDPYKLCSAEKIKRILEKRPGLKVCVPHLGVDEFEEYKSMAFEYDNLWLDTAMVIADYLPLEAKPDIMSYRKDRILYGSDFPNIPYAWDNEIKIIAEICKDSLYLDRLFYLNAKEFFEID